MKNKMKELRFSRGLGTGLGGAQRLDCFFILYSSYLRLLFIGLE